MGNLPKERITQSRLFINVGINYCGPFFIKERQYHNYRRKKNYVVVFVCLAVKAVHLEIVHDLTSEAFIAALQIFIARRGLRINLYSDNISNKLKEHHKEVTLFLSNQSINWHFIAPKAPYFVSLWEAAVKPSKHHLTSVAKTELFAIEKFTTLITQIGAILNSRPLTPISSDPNDLLVLIPGHFLIGGALTILRKHNYMKTRNPIVHLVGNMSKSIKHAVTVRTVSNTFDLSVKKLVPLPIQTKGGDFAESIKDATHPKTKATLLTSLSTGGGCLAEDMLLML
ncbi:uncharacterized protein LOC143432466 [Xylocopa sonorina]|uniref:uncharacterized protein LOC143432146 n=1 Tax=Xylocopa sonorina TaxID=1818115 RepID=UPI00403B1773